MKNRKLFAFLPYYFLALCLVWAMSISAQSGDASCRVHEKLQAFVASGEYNVGQGRVVTGDAISGGKGTAYDFSQVFTVENCDDAGMLFQHMKELEQTLRSEAVHASEVMIHDARQGVPLAPGVVWLIGNPVGTVSGEYVFDSKKNIRLLSYAHRHPQPVYRECRRPEAQGDVRLHLLHALPEE